MAGEMEVARKRQFEEKQKLLREQAEIERADYLAQIEKQKQIEAQERLVEE
jgi:hypothetical protein